MIYMLSRHRSTNKEKLAAFLGASRFSSGSGLNSCCGTADTAIHPAGTSAKEAIGQGTCVLLPWVHPGGHTFKPGYAEEL